MLNELVHVINNMLNSPGTIDFDEVRTGLEKKSFMYVDVRNKSELVSAGQIVGSVNNLPRMLNWLT